MTEIDINEEIAQAHEDIAAIQADLLPQASDVEGMVPSVSIIIVTYKRPAELACLLGLLEQQDYQDFEVVVVDGSPDANSERAKFWPSNALKLTYVVSQFHYLGVVRNIGILASRGEVVIFLDDDHYVSPDFVTRHVSLHRSLGRGEPLVAIGQCVARRNEPVPWVREVTRHVSPERYVRNPSAGAGNFSLPRLLAIQNCGFNPYIRLQGEETEFLKRLQNAGVPLVNAYEVAIVHRCSRHGGTRDTQDLRVRNLAIRIADRVMKKLSKWSPITFPIVLFGVLVRARQEILALGVAEATRPIGRELLAYCLPNIFKAARRENYFNVSRALAKYEGDSGVRS